jgi:hypothetical protein
LQTDNFDSDGDCDPDSDADPLGCSFLLSEQRQIPADMLLTDARRRNILDAAHWQQP